METCFIRDMVTAESITLMILIQDHITGMVEGIAAEMATTKTDVFKRGLLLTKLGEHIFQISTRSQSFHSFFRRSFHPEKAAGVQPDMLIKIEDGYGTAFSGYFVERTKTFDKFIYKRADYLIEVDAGFKSASLFAHDELALKHALMNLYSAFIVFHHWGLLIHSSCVINKGKAHIFAGQSGAGKSTAAKLSYPRDLLSDEATIVKIDSNEITVFDSPFRSELVTRGAESNSPLASIQLLTQAQHNERIQLNKPDAFLKLIDKVFYWPHEAAETVMIIQMLNKLVLSVPVFNLHFQKNNSFWELIS